MASALPQHSNPALKAFVQGYVGKALLGTLVDTFHREPVQLAKRLDFNRSAPRARMSHFPYVLIQRFLGLPLNVRLGVGMGQRTVQGQKVAHLLTNELGRVRLHKVRQRMKQTTHFLLRARRNNARHL